MKKLHEKIGKKHVEAHKLEHKALKKGKEMKKQK